MSHREKTGGQGLKWRSQHFLSHLEGGLGHSLPALPESNPGLLLPGFFSHVVMRDVQNKASAPHFPVVFTSIQNELGADGLCGAGFHPLRHNSCMLP